jgi:hypothetical protein
MGVSGRLQGAARQRPFDMGPRLQANRMGERSLICGFILRYAISTNSIALRGSTVKLGKFQPALLNPLARSFIS